MNLTQETAILRLRETANQAIRDRNLDLVFGNNGFPGRRATGNYTLIAAATGLSRVHVGKVLKGKAEPSYSLLLRLSEITGIGVGAISRYIQEQKKAA